jgi:hypothetical protein
LFQFFALGGDAEQQFHDAADDHEAAADDGRRVSEPVRTPATELAKVISSPSRIQAVPQ